MCLLPLSNVFFMTMDVVKRGVSRKDVYDSVKLYRSFGFRYSTISWYMSSVAKIEKAERKALSIGGCWCWVCCWLIMLLIGIYCEWILLRKSQTFYEIWEKISTTVRMDGKIWDINWFWTWIPYPACCGIVFLIMIRGNSMVTLRCVSAGGVT